MIALDVLDEDWLEPLGLSIVALIFSAILRLRYRVPMAAALGAAMLGHFLIYTIFDFLTAAASYYSPVFDGKYLYVATSLLLPYMLTLLFSGGIVFVLNRSEFAQYFAYLFHGRMRTAASLLVFFLLMNLKALLDRFFPGVTTDFSYGLFCCVLILFALFCIQFGAMYAASRDKVKAQEETIAQQQAHMALLEELQGRSARSAMTLPIFCPAWHSPRRRGMWRRSRSSCGAPAGILTRSWAARSGRWRDCPTSGSIRCAA